MNLFVLDSCPVKAAKQYCDRHCIKICLENSQLLCSVYQLQGIEAPYRLTHKNHPVSIWVRESRENFNWAVTHGLALCAEYTERYGKTHKCQSVIEWCRDNADKLTFDVSGPTPFAQAMPEEYKDPDSVKAYRRYYIFAKKHLHQWKQNRPNWIDNPDLI